MSEWMSVWRVSRGRLLWRIGILGTVMEVRRQRGTREHPFLTVDEAASLLLWRRARRSTRGLRCWWLLFARATVSLARSRYVRAVVDSATELGLDLVTTTIVEVTVAISRRLVASLIEQSSSSATERILVLVAEHEAAADRLVDLSFCRTILGENYGEGEGEDQDQDQDEDREQDQDQDQDEDKGEDEDEWSQGVLEQASDYLLHKQDFPDLGEDQGNGDAGTDAMLDAGLLEAQNEALRRLLMSLVERPEKEESGTGTSGGMTKLKLELLQLLHDSSLRRRLGLDVGEAGGGDGKDGGGGGTQIPSGPQHRGVGVRGVQILSLSQQAAARAAAWDSGRGMGRGRWRGVMVHDEDEGSEPTLSTLPLSVVPSLPTQLALAAVLPGSGPGPGSVEQALHREARVLGALAPCFIAPSPFDCPPGQLKHTDKDKGKGRDPSRRPLHERAARPQSPPAPGSPSPSPAPAPASAPAPAPVLTAASQSPPLSPPSPSQLAVGPKPKSQSPQPAQVATRVGSKTFLEREAERKARDRQMRKLLLYNKAEEAMTRIDREERIKAREARKAERKRVAKQATAAAAAAMPVATEAEGETADGTNTLAASQSLTLSVSLSLSASASTEGQGQGQGLGLGDTGEEKPFPRLVSTVRELPESDLFETERVARRAITKMRVQISAGDANFVNRPYGFVETTLLESPLATPIFAKQQEKVERLQRERRLKELQELAIMPPVKTKGKGMGKGMGSKRGGH